MKLSRLFLPLFFALSLLSAQQGSMAHAFSHLFAEQGHEQDKQAPHSLSCEKCASYAQLGSALHSALHEFTIGTFSDTQLIDAFDPFHSHQSLVVSARGPPALPHKTA